MALDAFGDCFRKPRTRVLLDAVPEVAQVRVVVQQVDDQLAQAQRVGNDTVGEIRRLRRVRSIRRAQILEAGRS